MYRSVKTLVADHRRLFTAAAAAFAVLWFALVGHRLQGDGSPGVLAWWTALCALSVANACAWRVSAAALERRRSAVEPDDYALQRWQLLLSAAYVFGCGFRSLLPRADVQRIGLFDSWASSVMVGRSVATVAEL